MITELFYIKETQVNPPANWQELGIELNYGKDQFPGGNTVTITDFEWVRENYDLLKKEINDGLTGGAGIFEGVPLRIDVTDGKATVTVFSGFINLVGAQIKDGIKITAKSMSIATVDWVNLVASGFTFEYLASLPSGSPGAIDSGYYRWMPYTRNNDTNGLQAAIATLMVYEVSTTIARVINEIADITIDLSNPFTAANAILQAIIKVGYLIVLIATLIKLIQDIYKFIISPVKYHAGMYVRDLFERACSYLNMNFSSDIWAPGSPYYNEFILPEKLYNAPSANDASIFGFLFPDENEQVGWYKGTFAKLLEAMKAKYCAKIVVTVPQGGATAGSPGTLFLIRKDKSALPPKYQLPEIYQPEYTYNADELPANYLIEYQTDSSEINTLQNYEGTIYQVICQPKVVNYRPNVQMKNFVQVQIPFARATVKTELNTAEIIVQDILSVFDALVNGLVSIINGLAAIANAIIDVLNDIIDALSFIGINVNWNIGAIPSMNYIHLAEAIGNRVGMLMLQSDHFNVPKIFILKQGSESKFNKIDSSNDTAETAKAMWDGFHYVNSFVPAVLNSAYADRPTGNQYLIKNLPAVPFDWQNFVDVFQNNRIFDSNGVSGIIESIKFNPYRGGGVAEMKVRFQKVFTLNLEESFLNPTGA